MMVPIGPRALLTPAQLIIIGAIALASIQKAMQIRY